LKIILLAALLLLTIVFSSLGSAYADKATGTSSPVVNSKNICGDQICDQPMTIKEKLGYYLLSFFECLFYP
jgi:hypothetical protein